MAIASNVKMIVRRFRMSMKVMKMRWQTGVSRRNDTCRSGYCNQLVLTENIPHTNNGVQQFRRETFVDLLSQVADIHVDNIAVVVKI